jgi:hypothetical protein
MDKYPLNIDMEIDLGFHGATSCPWPDEPTKPYEPTTKRKKKKKKKKIRGKKCRQKNKQPKCRLNCGQRKKEICRGCFCCLDCCRCGFVNKTSFL